MTILRSIFWLSLAFIAIGPRGGIGDATQHATQEALTYGQQAAIAHVSAMECADIACAGQQMILTAGIEMATDEVEKRFLQAPIDVAEVPFPMPRLARN